MTTLKGKSWRRRSRTTMCPSSAPQVVTDQPASLRDDISPKSKKSFNKVVEDFQELENLTKVENLPLADPRVKHVRERIESAMPFLNELTSKEPSPRHLNLLRHAEQVLHSTVGKNSSNPPKKSTNLPPTGIHFATQGSSPSQRLKEVSPKTRSIRSNVEPTPTLKPTTPSPASGGAASSESQISFHQIAMLTAVHNAISSTIASRDAPCSWTEAPAAVSPEELLRRADAPPGHHHPSAAPCAASNQFNPALGQANAAMIQPPLPSQQPNLPLQYQSSAYLPMQPKLASSSIHALRRNGTSEPAD